MEVLDIIVIFLYRYNLKEKVNYRWTASVTFTEVQNAENDSVYNAIIGH